MTLDKDFWQIAVQLARRTLRPGQKLIQSHGDAVLEIDERNIPSDLLTQLLAGDNVPGVRWQD